MEYSHDFISGVYAHATKAVKLTCLVSGSLPVDHDGYFHVGLLSDGNKNCSLFVMAGEAELLRSELFEWKNNNETTERLFKLCDYISPAAWAQMDAANHCSWNLRKLDTKVILRVLNQGYSEIDAGFDQTGWRKRRAPQKRA